MCSKLRYAIYGQHLCKRAPFHGPRFLMNQQKGGSPVGVYGMPIGSDF